MAPPARPTPPPARNRPWLLPLVIIGVGLLGAVLLLALPFGGDDEDEERPAPVRDTVGEVDAPPAAAVDTGTIVDLEPDAPRTTTTTPPTTTTLVVPPTATIPPAQVPTPITPPAREQEREPEPDPEPRPVEREISEREAMATLRGYLQSSGAYEVSNDCLEIASEGYENVGYTLSVRDVCDSRTLGRWRVDSKTREIFRQRGDGRYLRP